MSMQAWKKPPLSLGRMSDIQRPALTMPIHSLPGGLAGVVIMLGLLAVISDPIQLMAWTVMAGVKYKSVLVVSSNAFLLLKML